MPPARVGRASPGRIHDQFDIRRFAGFLQERGDVGFFRERLIGPDGIRPTKYAIERLPAPSRLVATPKQKSQGAAISAHIDPIAGVLLLTEATRTEIPEQTRRHLREGEMAA